MDSSVHSTTDHPSQDSPGEERPAGATALLESIIERAELTARRTADYEEKPTGDAAPADVGADENAEASEGPTIKLGTLFGQMEERAHGVLLLILALPCCLPFVYILPQLVSLPMLFISGQLAVGLHAPWLPKKLSERELPVWRLRNVVDRAKRYIGWVERFARPRLSFMTGHVGSRVVGGLLLIPSASIMLPIPSTNTVPGIGVAVASVGMIERDGLLVLIGLTIGLIWVACLVFLGASAASLVMDFIRPQT